MFSGNVIFVFRFNDKRTKMRGIENAYYNIG